MGLLDSGHVNNEALTKNEKKVLYGITRYPTVNDSELADIIDVKLSTLTSIKRRLADNGYYRTLMIPLVNRLGCELLAIIYMQFNPVIPLGERVETTKKTIEVFDEIFFSVGEEEKGFSMSLSQNYTNIGRINEIRTETFGRLGLLEKEYPHEVIFPFETSHIHRFFDFAPILKQLFTIEDDRKKQPSKDLFSNVTPMDFTTKEKKVYNALVEHPTATTQQIGEHVGLSRHTVARMKNQFFDDGLLQLLTLALVPVHGIPGSLVYDHMFYGRGFLDSIISLVLQRYLFAPSPETVTGDHRGRLAVVHPVTERRSAEP